MDEQGKIPRVLVIRVPVEDDELRLWLKLYAARRHVSMGEVVRKLLDDLRAAAEGGKVAPPE